jgi:hypothetical protein
MQAREHTIRLILQSVSRWLSSLPGAKLSARRRRAVPGIFFNPRSDVTFRKATGATDVDQDPYPTSQYVLWAYRLLLGREPEDPRAVELYPETSRRRVVEIFISSPEFLGNQIGNVCSYHRRYMVELEDGLRFWLISGDQYVSPAMAAGDYEDDRSGRAWPSSMSAQTWGGLPFI